VGGPVWRDPHGCMNAPWTLPPGPPRVHERRAAPSTTVLPSLPSLLGPLRICKLLVLLVSRFLLVEVGGPPFPRKTRMAPLKMYGSIVHVRAAAHVRPRGYADSISYIDSVSNTDSVRRSVPHATHHRDSAAWMCTSVWVAFVRRSCAAAARG